jgi:hypothetical protein
MQFWWTGDVVVDPTINFNLFSLFSMCSQCGSLGGGRHRVKRKKRTNYYCDGGDLGDKVLFQNK